MSTNICCMGRQLYHALTFCDSMQVLQTLQSTKNLQFALQLCIISLYNEPTYQTSLMMNRSFNIYTIYEQNMSPLWRAYDVIISVLQHVTKCHLCHWVYIYNSAQLWPLHLKQWQGGWDTAVCYSPEFMQAHKDKMRG